MRIRSESELWSHYDRGSSLHFCVTTARVSCARNRLGCYEHAAYISACLLSWKRLPLPTCALQDKLDESFTAFNKTRAKNSAPGIMVSQLAR